MAKGMDMKVNMTADNSDVVKKSREARNAIRDFEKVGSDALGRLGDAFGVNTGKIGQMGSAIKGLGMQMQSSGNAGAAAFGKLLSGVSGLSAAIAGIGVGAAVTGFKLLNAEATAFKNTVQGANIELQTAAYISTYAQTLHDANEAIGESTAETLDRLTRRFKTFWENTKFVAVNTIAEIGKEGWSGDDGAGDRALAKLREVRSVATEAATEAESIAARMYDIQVEMSDKTVEWARMEREIAEYKRIAYDKTVDLSTQQYALNQATELIAQRYGEEAEYRKEIADLQARYNGLASSSLSDIQKANQYRIEEENTLARMNNALRELSERQASIATQAQKEADARSQALAAAQATAQSRADLQAWRDSIGPVSPITAGATTSMAPTLAFPSPTESKIAIEDWWGTVTASLGDLKIHFALDPNDKVAISEDMVDISNELQQTLSSVADTVGMTIGSLVGDLVTGGDAWSNFTNTALSAFGDMAVSIGRMAIQTGIATLGIKAALESLNGWVAIAAGTALVALGSAVKSGLSNIASGGYSSSASVATSGNYGASSSVTTAYETREVNVKVKGQLYASGNQLMAVIENENNRKNHTT